MDTPLFRHELLEQAQAIFEQWYEGDLAVTSGEILRAAWECSRSGQRNVLVQAAYASAVDDIDVLIRGAIFTPGFLTSQERWHNARKGGERVVLYRGCSRKEAELLVSGTFCLDDIGFSWTQDPEVAAYFADFRDAVVVRAEVCPKHAVWLDTSEAEWIVLPSSGDSLSSVAIVEVPLDRDKRMEWSARPRLTPQHAQRSA